MEFTLAKSSMNKTMPFFHAAINLTKLTGNLKTIARNELFVNQSLSW